MSEQAKPIRHLEAYAPDVIRQLAAGRQPVIITVHGEAKAVLHDVTRYQETQENVGVPEGAGADE